MQIDSSSSSSAFSSSFSSSASSSSCSGGDRINVNLNQSQSSSSCSPFSSASSTRCLASCPSVVSAESRLFDSYSHAVQAITLNFSSHAGDPINGSPNFNVDLGHLFDFTEPTRSVEVSGTQFGSNRVRLQPPTINSSDSFSSSNGGEATGRSEAKRFKRKNGSDIPSTRAVSRSKKKLEHYGKKLNTKLVWSETNKGSCCNNKCNEMAKLPPSDLLTLRRYLHSPPNDTLQRNYFNRMILASLTSSSQAAEMLQTFGNQTTRRHA